MENYETDAADDDLHNIINLKNELTDWLDNCRHKVGQTPQRFSSPNFKEADDMGVSFEEAFDDLWHSEWHRLTAISGSVQWTREIPSCEILRALKAKEKMQARRPIITNPATRIDGQV